MATGLLGSVNDVLTGNENNTAQNDLQAALNQILGVSAPTTQQLQLSPLAQYESTGNLNPAEMQAAQAGNNALANEDLSSVPMSVMQQALAQEGTIANAQGMTPQEQSQIAQAEETVNENTAGQRGAIAQQFAGEGVPQSLISAALQNQSAGQNSEQEYQNALQAQGQAANQGITALANEGQLAGQEYGLQAGQANTVAAAQNALNQFNAQNTQQAGLANQANQQAANTYNTQNAQTLANQNVQGEQEAQYQNEVVAPQQAYQDALQKAEAAANAENGLASQATGVGQQTAGVASGIVSALGSGASAVGTGMGYGAGIGGASTAVAASEGGEIPPKSAIPPTSFRQGGRVPGMAPVAGDSPENDVVPARLSPGEVVLPRTVAQNPGAGGSHITQFLKNKAPNVAAKMAPSAHPSDIKSILRALSEMRAGA
jgi:hypothetical protein